MYPRRQRTLIMCLVCVVELQFSDYLAEERERKMKKKLLFL